MLQKPKITVWVYAPAHEALHSGHQGLINFRQESYKYERTI